MCGVQGLGSDLAVSERVMQQRAIAEHWVAKE